MLSIAQWHTRTCLSPTGRSAPQGLSNQQFDRIEFDLIEVPFRRDLIKVTSHYSGTLCRATVLTVVSFLLGGSAALSQVTLTPSSLSFGSHALGGTTGAKSATLNNTQTVPLTISSIAMSGGTAPSDFAWSGNCPLSPNTLAAGASCSLAVTFTPSGLGSRTTSLTITDDASNSPQAVALSGTGVAPVALSPASLSFGNQVEGVGSAAKTITLKNAQSVPLTISSITVSGGTAQGDFSSATTCPISPNTLAAAQSCSITVTFTPSALGGRTSSVVVTDDATGSPQAVSLTGTGTAPVTFSPAGLKFGSRLLGTTSGAQTVTVTNHLSTTLAFSSITASGDFAVATNTCGSSVGAGLTCSIGITFAPTAIGTRQGTLTISDSAFGSPSLITLSGTGNVNGLTSIAVTPANPSIAAGNTQQFTATGNFNGGKTQSLTPFVTWSSSAPNVATIATGGLATTASTGTSSIGATINSITGSTTLTVTPPVLVSITVTPANSSIPLGNTQQFSASGTYSDGSTQNLTSAVTWSSSAPAVATISNASGSQGLSTTVAMGATTITATSGTTSGATLFTITGGFVNTGSLNNARSGHTATLLNNQMVLIAGGTNNPGGSGALASAELYSAPSGTFAMTGSLNAARYFHTATLLDNGTVLLVGGEDATGNALSSAELYDPVAQTFTLTASLNVARISATATLLTNGKVLIAGGKDSTGNALASAELYDPSAKTFTLTGSLNTARSQHTATPLSNGTVLVAGGQDSNGNALASAEVFVPATGAFSVTGNLTAARYSHTATLLNSGMVLLAGGESAGAPIAVSELYNSTAGTFAASGNLNTARYGHSATLMNNGMVLIAGGSGASGVSSTAELYDPTAGSFSFASSLNTARQGHTGSLLNNGAVLVAGGVGAAGSLSAVELFQPVTLTPPNLISIAVTPTGVNLVLGTALQFVATGTFGDNSTQQLASATWNSSDSTIAAVSNDSTNSGMAYGIADGAATLSACAGSLCGSASLTVGPPPLVSIAVTPQGGTLQAGTSAGFDAVGTYADGSTQDLSSTVTWSSSVPTVATVTAGGLVTGVTTGVSTISATAANIVGSSKLMVTTTVTLPMGSVNSVTSETCPVNVNGAAAGWVTQTSGGTDVVAQCYRATVSCPSMPDLSLTYGVSTPAGTSLGTIAFVSAKGGQNTLPGDFRNDAPFDLFHYGFQVVQFAWDLEWQSGSSSGSLKTAACREATFLNYVNTQYYAANPNNSPTAGMCAHSQSGGASGLAYSLTYYGAGSYLDKAVFVSGPHYSDMVQGCALPSSPPVNICPSPDGINYPMGCNSAAGSWTDPPAYTGGAAKNLSGQLANNPPCDDPTHNYTVQDDLNLTATSMVDGQPDANYNYPHTAVTAWLCDDDGYWQNPAEGQGWIYFSQLRDPSQVAPNCNYSNKNTPYPNACMVVNHVYGCATIELAATGYICSGSTCPVCTGTPATNCTCGGVPCSSVEGTYGMPTFREEEYEDPVNGCIKRH